MEGTKPQGNAYYQAVKAAREAAQYFHHVMTINLLNEATRA